MELLKDPKMTFSSVASFTSLYKSTIVRIFDKHCHIPRILFPEVICIDEVYAEVNRFDAKYLVTSMTSIIVLFLMFFLIEGKATFIIIFNLYIIFVNFSTSNLFVLICIFLTNKSLKSILKRLSFVLTLSTSSNT